MQLNDNVTLTMTAVPGMYTRPEEYVREILLDMGMDPETVIVDKVSEEVHTVNVCLSDIRLEGLIKLVADLSCWMSVMTLVLYSGDVCIFYSQEEETNPKAKYKGQSRHFIRVY